MEYPEHCAYFNNSDRFMRYNHMEILSVTDTEARARLTVTPEGCNGLDVVHGGGYFTLADCAAGALARADGRVHVTQSSSFSFLRTVGSGTVEAVATILNRGRTVCVISVSLYSGETGKLVAVGTFQMFCVTK